MLRLAGIDRSFNGRQVLDDVGFEVHPGRLTGFVGANGAGKTTTMRIILGLLAPHSGTVTFDGNPIGERERRRFGYMPEERGLYPKMPVAEQISYLGRLHGMSTTDASRRTTALLERLGLAERASDNVEKLSLGNQQRAQIAAALVHEPDVLVLDEPFSGLDPVAVDTVQGVLQEYAERGVPTVFSSHQLDIVERLCDDLVIIADGRILAAGDTVELRDRFAPSRYEIELTNEAGWIEEVPGVTVVESAPHRVIFDADAGVAQAVLRQAIDAGPVASFAPHRPSLTQIFTAMIR